MISYPPPTFRITEPHVIMHVTAFSVNLPFNSATQTTTCSISNHAEKPRNVGIAGAGIAGLATALTLLKTPDTGVQHVTIFEPRESLDLGMGAALNLSGGAAILSKLYNLDFLPISRPMSHVTARHTSGSLLFEVDVLKQILMDTNAKQWLVQNDQLLFRTIMRDSLQQLLQSALQNCSVTIRRGSSYKVAHVTQNAQHVHFIFTNGTQSPPFDLIIGADGVRSAVRNYVDPFTPPPQYSGFRVQWAITPVGQCTLLNEHVEQWFGDGGYVLRYAAGPQNALREMIALSFRESTPARENPDYDTQQHIRNDCETRLRRIGMPNTIMDVFERATQFIETAVYYHPRLSTWSRNGNCVLLGDSAHAMPPFLGQGANQAIQDAHALAQALTKIGTDKHIQCLNDALQQFESARSPPTSAILQSSRIIGLLETQGGALGTAVRDNLFRLAGFTGAAGQTLIQSAIPRLLS